MVIKPKINRYIVWTDGSYKSSTDCGGFSSIITQDEKIVKIIYSGYKNTTNNRMELRGVLATLEYFKTPTNLTIYTDSQYVVSSINNNHVKRWLDCNDVSKKNMDLWKRIYDLTQYHTVSYNWVKGHNGNKFNELSDLYAQHAADCVNLKNEYEITTEKIR